METIKFILMVVAAVYAWHTLFGGGEQMTNLKRSQKKRIYNELAVSTILLLVSLAINVTTVLRVVNRPIETVVIHKADNAVELHGKVTGKSMVGKLYTLDCGAYGKFLVSKEQYDSVNVGDDIPSYLKERGK